MEEGISHWHLGHGRGDLALALVLTHALPPPRDPPRRAAGARCLHNALIESVIYLLLPGLAQTSSVFRLWASPTSGQLQGRFCVPSPSSKWVSRPVKNVSRTCSKR